MGEPAARGRLGPAAAFAEGDDAPLAASLAGLDDPPRSAMERLAGLGARGVVLDAAREGVRPRDLDAVARRSIRSATRRMGLEITGIDLWIPPGHFLDPLRADRAVDATLAAIELAADLGRATINITLPAAPDEPTAAGAGVGGDAAAPSAGERDRVLEAILRKADRFGVRIADHAIGATRSTGGVALTSLAGAVSAEASAAHGVGIDPVAWLARDIDPAEAIAHVATATGGARLAAARLCDLTRSGMRAAIADERSGAAAHEARLDPTTYARALELSAMVAGSESLWPIIDARQWAEPWRGIERTIEVWRRAQPE
ncbi:MAG TPA: TIM barrel protein [Phycisphaerales bacterium]|nr:TIM barrel protein [Phycisphaerales bacterium]HMP36751.1 TIM barrel protein [Phycisphaerales bacterium]